MGHAGGLNQLGKVINQHPRRLARESVMQALYAVEINDGYPKDILDLYNQSFNVLDDSEYMHQLFFCVRHKSFFNL